MAAAGPAIMPSTQLERLYQRVDEVEEMLGKRWARRGAVRRGGEHAGARWSSWQQWCFTAGKKKGDLNHDSPAQRRGGRANGDYGGAVD